MTQKINHSNVTINNAAQQAASAKAYPSFTWKSEGTIDSAFIDQTIGSIICHVTGAIKDMAQWRDQRNLWIAGLSLEQRRAVLCNCDGLTVSNDGSEVDEHKATVGLMDIIAILADKLNDAQAQQSSMSAQSVPQQQVVPANHPKASTDIKDAGEVMQAPEKTKQEGKQVKADQPKSTFPESFKPQLKSKANELIKDAGEVAPEAKARVTTEDEAAQAIINILKQTSANPFTLFSKVKDLYLTGDQQ